jgi:hypothetical protein
MQLILSSGLSESNWQRLERPETPVVPARQAG